MKITVRGYITHKDAEQYSDCADRYAVSSEHNKFAIADGVSRSFFPAIWAEILVNRFVSADKDINFSIEKCQKEWLEKVTAKVNLPDAKWFTKNAFIKKEAGLATFVRLCFENGKWVANALGDSFLFFVPKDSKGFDDWVKLSSKPEPVVFDSFPDYYSSRNPEHGEKKSTERDLQNGTFYLMTDALSEWVFSQKEKAIEEIRENWHSQEEFERCVAELRSLKALNDDDSAILIIDLDDDGKPDLSYEKVEVQEIDKLIENEKIERTQPIQTEEKQESFVEAEKAENKKEESIEQKPLRDTTELSSGGQKAFEECIKKIEKMNDQLKKKRESEFDSCKRKCQSELRNLEESQRQIIIEKINDKYKENGFSLSN
jgi:hypothetical protein